MPTLRVIACPVHVHRSGVSTRQLAEIQKTTAFDAMSEEKAQWFCSEMATQEIAEEWGK